MRYFLNSFVTSDTNERKIKNIDFVKRLPNKEKEKVTLTAVKKLLKDELAVGYTNRKKKKEKDCDDVFISDDMILNYREKNRFFHKIYGYIPCDCADNFSKFSRLDGKKLYIGVLKFNYGLLLVPLILCLILCLAFCHNSNNAPTKPWNPVIEDSTVSNENITVDRSKQIEMQGFSNWFVPAGKTDNLKISLLNPQDNPCYFTFEIRLRENDELLYKSKLLPPGKEIKSIDISRSLEKGTYNAYVHIIPQALETGDYMNETIFDIQIEVN